MVSKLSFIQIFTRSASDTSYYQEIRHKSFWFSVRYLGFLLLLISLASAIILSISLATLVGKSPAFVLQTKSYLDTAYPKDLQIIVKDGELTTNVTEPYYIPYPPQLKAAIDRTKNQYDHFITIDTKANADNFNDYHTLILVTKKSIVYPDSKSENTFKVQQFDHSSNSKPFVLNKTIYDTFLLKMNPYIDMVPSFLRYAIVAILIFWPFLGTLFLLLWNLFYLLFASIFVLIVSLIMGKDLSYGEVYRLSMHGMTIPLLYGFVATLFGFHVPLSITAILIIWMIFVLREIPTIAQKNAVIQPKKKKAKK